MDQFLVNIYESIIYKWVVLNSQFYAENNIVFSIDESDPVKLVFKTDHLVGEIYFWTTHHIIEETIIDENDNIVFYLHFRVINLLTTKNFIYDFFNHLCKKERSVHIGMSCSCGMTSSIFVERIQQLSDLMRLPYHFDVVPVHSIEKKYLEYDMIILAPQTSYLEPKLKLICQKDCLIISMDVSVFATSNYQRALMIIQEKLE